MSTDVRWGQPNAPSGAMNSHLNQFQAPAPQFDGLSMLPMFGDARNDMRGDIDLSQLHLRFPLMRRAGSETHLSAYARAAHAGLPTVSEDGIFSNVMRQDAGQDPEVELLERIRMGGQVPEGSAEPAHTLVVRHISSDTPDDELRSIFQAFGDLRSLNTAAKHQGLVLVTYFDVRGAMQALSTLQGTLVKNIPLSIQYAHASPDGAPDVNQGTVVVFNLDPETTNEHLVWLFSKFGDVKGIRESPNRPNQKFIMFFDVRHAAAARKAMNRAEQLGRSPVAATQQMTSLSSHMSAPNLLQLAADAQASGSMLPWDASASPRTMENLYHLVKQHPRSSSNLGPGSGPALDHSPTTSISSQHDLPLPPVGGAAAGPSGQGMHGGPGMHHAGPHMGPQPHGFNMGMGMQQRHMHISDSASSIATAVPGAAAAAAAMAKSLSHGHLPTIGSNQALRPSSLDALNMFGAQQAPSAAAAAAAHQLQVLQQTGTMSASDAANMLMGFSLAGAGPAPPVPPPTVGSHGDLQQLWAAADAGNAAAAAAAAAGMWPGAGAYGSSAAAAAAAGAAAAAAAAANSPAGLAGMTGPALANLQQHQQHAAAAAAAQQVLANQLAGLQAQQALQAAAAAGAGQQAANMAAAAQLLQAAGLGNVLGSNAAAAACLPGALAGAAAAAANPHMSAAAAILQQAGLTMPTAGLQSLGTMHGALGGAAAAAGLLGQRNSSASNLVHLGAGRSAGGMSMQGMGSDGGMGMQGMGGGQGGGPGMSGARSGGRLSRRTTDPVAEAERKAQQEKLYALDMDKIRAGEDRRTTLMIKNIPNKYTQRMLLQTIDEHFKGTYDFFYLPIDFKNKCNVGYAFINMIQPINIIPLVQRFDLRKWERFNSEKVCSISYARIQGRSALVQHFQNSSLMHEDKRCRPILFTLEDSGEAAGEQEPFPTNTSGGGASSGREGGSLGGSGVCSPAAPLSTVSSYASLAGSRSRAGSSKDLIQHLQQQQQLQQEGRASGGGASRA